MPESVTDRCTKSHEYLFLLAKSQHYYFDAEAIREEQCESTLKHAPRIAIGKKGLATGVNGGQSSGSAVDVGGRNRRSVWTIATEPCKEAHFATFPRKLVEPCIRAGTSEKGCCPKCGKPWERIVTEGTGGTKGHAWLDHEHDEERGNFKTGSSKGYQSGQTLGWQPSCECGLEPVPCTVFDLFSGSGTVGLVALPLGRNYIGIELNPDYCAMARKRLLNECGLIAKETT
jgi:hypothetical protein